MFHVNGNGILTLDARNKSSALIRVNGLFVSDQKQLCDGDVLTIGKYSSASWMTLNVKTRRVVTPEVRKLPMKKLIKRRREADGMGQEYQTFGFTKISTDVTKQTPAATGAFSWERTVLSRKRLCVQEKLTGTPSSSPSVEISHSKSQDELLSSNESNHVPSVTPQKQPRRATACGLYETDCHVPKVTPQPRMPRTRHGNDDQTTNKDNEKMPGETARRSLLVRYALTRTPKKSWGDDSSPESGDNNQLDRASLVDDDKNKRSTEEDIEQPCSTSSKTSLETQFGQKNDSPPCTLVEDTILSLPQCPTYDGESSDVEVESHCIHGRSERFDINESLHQTNDTATVLATELSTNDWADFCNHDDAVRRSLANLIVTQRSLRQDNDWLPDMIQGAVVD